MASEVEAASLRWSPLPASVPHPQSSSTLIPFASISPSTASALSSLRSSRAMAPPSSERSPNPRSEPRPTSSATNV